MSWRSVLLLVSYLLLAPWAFVLGPLAGLLLLTHPRTAREWIWIAFTASLSLFWLQIPGGLAAQVVRAAVVLVAGAYLALTMWRPSATIGRAALAIGIASVGLVGLMVHAGIEWTELRAAAAHAFRVAEQALPREYRVQMPLLAKTTAELFPALLALTSVAGLQLAWAWHCRLADQPLGPAPAPFRSFRFSDHWIWGWIVVLAISLLYLPSGWSIAAINLAVVLSVLYAVRGLAVFAASAGRISPPLAAVLAIVTLVLLPFVVGGLMLLGLADTWLNFRGRRATPATRGFD